ncbi:MAG: hypothetical protein EOM91_24225 [Sphingobacteriia bacterium]|nr:hypothetical protein [Sphingobacteriia bacterium]
MSTRRRTRCQYCGDLYHSAFGIRGVCDACLPAWVEIADLQLTGVIADSEDYAAVVAPLARGCAELYIDDAIGSRIHASWRRMTPEQRIEATREIRRIIAETKEQTA